METILVSLGSENNAVSFGAPIVPPAEVRPRGSAPRPALPPGMSPEEPNRGARDFSATVYQAGQWLTHSVLGVLALTLDRLKLPGRQVEAETGARIGTLPVFGEAGAPMPIGQARVSVYADRIEVGGTLALKHPHARELSADFDAGLPLDLLLEVEPERVGPDTIERDGETAAIVRQGVVKAVHLVPAGFHAESPKIAKLHGRQVPAFEVEVARRRQQGEAPRAAAAAVAERKPELLHEAKGRARTKAK